MITCHIQRDDTTYNNDDGRTQGNSEGNSPRDVVDVSWAIVCFLSLVMYSTSADHLFYI